jgi:hypothetical protein
VGTLGREDDVVGAPRDQRRRLVLAQPLLHRRVERRVDAVIEEGVELDLVVAGSVEQSLVNDPVVG